MEGQEVEYEGGREDQEGEEVVDEEGKARSLGPNEVKLRVYDEGLQTEKEFYCETRLLLAHMSYFKKYLTESDDTDILIHCDIYVFTWLMKYVKAREVEQLPVLNDENCLPVLIASNFLEMDTLVGECVSYIAENFLKLLQMPTDLNFLTQDLVDQLAEEMTLVTLEEVWQEVDAAGKRPKTKGGDSEVKSLGAKNLLDKLYERKLSKMMEGCQDSFAWCTTCCKIFCKSFGDELFCPKAKIRISLDGEVNARHQAKEGWEVTKYLPKLKELCHNRHLYWFFWSKLTRLECKECKEVFMASNMRKCTFHPKKALYPPTELCGYYLCCKKDASKFNSLGSVSLNTGCKEQEHRLDLAHMTEDEQKVVSLFRQQLSHSMPMYAELDNFNFGASSSSDDGEPSASGGQLQGSTTGSQQSSPPSRSSPEQAEESLVDSNLKFYFNYMRNQQSQQSRGSLDIKLRLFGQTYQEASWQANGEGMDRSQKGRRSILSDALHNMDCHRMQSCFSDLSSHRKDLV
ncbi:DUF3342 domain-containing protein [Chloropicon primus]|uniref:DUF3342 domain-containing protein n=1 Tax=Chloropicon primus TaxID=1764295 RepID=A0A5B8MJ57_9CHLO|nr:DUF3342 domain-containing protein [Chloropicon primus]UPQ99648.1 DUF3342 domain-containing protein [Chloropicon primus]|eukprot:QDZ20439.1 DUF3342 domain-containing protein [Chloropicon primus]